MDKRHEITLKKKLGPSDKYTPVESLEWKAQMDLVVAVKKISDRFISYRTRYTLKKWNHPSVCPGCLRNYPISVHVQKQE